MGMYDYLGGEQIKIFYRPIFNEEDAHGAAGTWHSGGSLNSYNEESELPLKTLYYKYPQNFIVFDYRNAAYKTDEYEYDKVWIIKNGKFKELKKYSSLTAEDIGKAVYTYYGYKLNIESPEDFIKIVKEFKEAYELCNKQEKELFPEGTTYAIRNNLEEYNKKKPLLEEIRKNTLGKFNDKWYKEDKYELEKQFGEYLYCYIELEGQKDNEIFQHYNPMQRYLDCKKAFKDFIIANSNIINRYTDWYGLLDDVTAKFLAEVIQ